VAPVDHPVSDILTPLQFRRLFTTSELVAIKVASATDYALQVMFDDISVAQYINKKDQRTIDAINYLVSRNLITAARKNEILA